MSINYTGAIEGLDPRGPERTIVAVDKSGTRVARVTLSCGHVREWNILYSYEIGERGRCLACGAADFAKAVQS